MRILITGGAGCLGSNLIEHWQPKGHEIFVIDNFATGKREVLPQVTGLEVVEGSTLKSKEKLDFVAQVSLTEGLKKTIAWTRQNLPFIESCMKKHDLYISTTI